MAHSKSRAPSKLIDRRGRTAWLATLLLNVLGLVAPVAVAAGEYLQLFVTEPYLELHIGPGHSYPVTQVVPRGEAIDVLYRRTQWFRVRTERGVEGWVRDRELSLATLADGRAFSFDFGNRANYESHRWEGGASLGELEGAKLISVYASRALVNQLSLELNGSQFLGGAANGYLANIGLAYVLAPDWNLAPFLTLGTGVIHTQPKSLLVAQPDSTDQTAYVGAGLRWYWTQRLFVRGEYRTYKVFTNRNATGEINEWKLGLAFFL